MSGDVFHLEGLASALLWNVRGQVDSQGFLRTRVAMTARGASEPGTAYFMATHTLVAHWRLQDSYIFRGAVPERGDDGVDVFLERVLGAHFDATPLAVVAAHALDFATDSLEAAVLAQKGYGAVRARTLRGRPHPLTVLEAATHEDELDLLEGIGITVLPGPQVFWPPTMAVGWVPGTSVCFVANPDTGVKLPHRDHGTPYVLAHHTVLMFGQ